MDHFINTFRAALKDLLEDHNSFWGKVMAFIIVGLILLSIGLFILETTPWGISHYWYLNWFDRILIALFTFEYFGRLWIAPRKLRFVFSWFGLLDLAVLCTFYLSLGYWTILRGFRVFKIFEVMNMMRYSHITGQFIRSFHYYRNEFFVFWLMFGSTLLLSSCVMYMVEHQVNEKMATVPDCLWWAIVTLATVGYGDVVPITPLGKLIAGVVILLGLGIVAIMTGIVTKIFMDNFFGIRYHHCPTCEYPHHDSDAICCKRCGHELDLGLHSAKKPVIEAVEETVRRVRV